MTYSHLDINGRRDRVFGYVIRDLHYDRFLGKGWAKANHFVYNAGKCEECKRSRCYPLPFIRKTLGELAKTGRYMKLGVHAAFYHMPIAEGEECKGSFE
ncbi:uncharacterized protein CPUR_01344 [Claviceps purpurea 20.1]|uniref:Uncharacterized protein n=1 Tax=Claviceps purpurea (strain 20.1) TaxID=1111077 RepID=M1W2R7_CLAP2|nr:uncharacterized protein CPUR_01344 [Claviceps purpurea 20.1]